MLTVLDQIFFLRARFYILHVTRIHGKPSVQRSYVIHSSKSPRTNLNKISNVKPVTQVGEQRFHIKSVVANFPGCFSPAFFFRPTLTCSLSIPQSGFNDAICFSTFALCNIQQIFLLFYFRLLWQCEKKEANVKLAARVCLHERKGLCRQ